MIFNGKELKAAVHEAAGIKNARIAYDAESRCVIISGDSLRIEIGGVAATEDSWGGAPESFVVPKLAAKYIEALTDGDICVKVDGDKPREGRQSQGSSEQRQGGDPAASERQSCGLHAQHERQSRACELLRIRQGSGKAAFEREIVEPAQMAPVDGDDSIQIPSGTLRAMVGAVKHAVAAITEQRVALTGIRLFTSPDGLTMEACDGVRLARAQAPATWTNDIDCVVPADALMKAASMADDGDMVIRADGRRIELTSRVKDGRAKAAASEGRAGTLPRASGGYEGCMQSMNGEAGHANFVKWSLRTMLIAAEPFDFTKAFEAVGGIEPIRVEAREMAAVLNRCVLAIGLSKLFVVVHVAGDGLTIEKKGAFSMFSEAVSGVEAGKAEEGSYAYNAAHLMAAVAAAKDAQAGLVFGPKTKMLCVQADMEDVRYRAIVMPVRVEGVA